MYNDLLVKVGINASFFETGFLGLGKFANVAIHGICVFTRWSSIALWGKRKGVRFTEDNCDLGSHCDVGLLNKVGKWNYLRMESEGTEAIYVCF